MSYFALGEAQAQSGQSREALASLERALTILKTTPRSIQYGVWIALSSLSRRPGLPAILFDAQFLLALSLSGADRWIDPARR